MTEQTFTLACTDIVGSTALNSRLGETEMRTLWDLHDRSSRDLLRRWDGREIDRSDGLLAIFDKTENAASFLAEYHLMLKALPTPMAARAGLHLGPLVVRRSSPDDLALGAKALEVIGLAKASCSRLMSLSEGGQTLASAEAASALAASPSFFCQSHGHWRLKGLDKPIEIFEVGSADTLFFPPPDGDKAFRVVLAHGDWVATRDLPRYLPAEGDSFFGRRTDLLNLARLAAEGRSLVTLTGTGGIGKTRLALRYAWGWLGAYSGGAYFCDLAQAENVEGIASAVARALELPLGAQPVSQLGNAIAGRGRCLMVLDNFEQVAGCAAETIGFWLDAAPQAQFLVTSRERLGLRGERVLTLKPLEGEAAVDLFNDRAHAVDGDYRPDELNSIMLPLVDLLDGLPLAIELAAARVSVVRPAALLSLIGQRFKLLASRGGRPDRHATLLATLEWSWDLLSGAERCALAQISVFEGSFSLTAAESVLDFASVPSAPWVIDLLQALVDKSLLRAVANGRYGLLRCIREFAVEKLAGVGRFFGSGKEMAEATAHRHRRFFARLSEAEAVRLDCVELDNIVVACRNATANNDAESALACLRLAWAALRLVGPFATAMDLAVGAKVIPSAEPQAADADWVHGASLYAAGLLDEARVAIDRGLASSSGRGEPLLLARLHCCLGEICSAQGDGQSAARHLATAHAHSQRCGDVSIRCQVLNAQGALAAEEGRVDEARLAYGEALRVAESGGDRRWQAGVLGNLGVLLMAASDYDEALAACRLSLSHASASSDQRWVGNAHCNLGLIFYEKNTLDDAERHLSQALLIARRLGHRALELTTLCNLGLVSEKRGDLAKAREHHQAAVEGAERLVDPRFEAHIRAFLGSVEARLGRNEQARLCLKRAVDLLAPTSDRHTLGLVLCSTAENEFLDGRLADADSAAKTASEIVAGLGAEETSELGRRLAQVKSLMRVPVNHG